jgi:carbon monoxide dehydrogenase subunit G
MPQFSESIEIKRSPEEVWRAISTPERWLEGYFESRQRSPEYPAVGATDERLYRTRMKEEVRARIARSEAPSSLVEEQEGKTFSRRARYSLSPSATGTHVQVDDDFTLKGVAKLAAPLASRDVKGRWARSLQRLKAVVEEHE